MHGSAEFLAPLIETRPRSGRPPLILNLSTMEERLIEKGGRGKWAADEEPKRRVGERGKWQWEKWRGAETVSGREGDSKHSHRPLTHSPIRPLGFCSLSKPNHSRRRA